MQEALRLYCIRIYLALDSHLCSAQQAVILASEYNTADTAISSDSTVCQLQAQALVL